MPYRHVNIWPYRHVNNWILDFGGVMAVWEVLGFGSHYKSSGFMIDD